MKSRILVLLLAILLVVVLENRESMGQNSPKEETSLNSSTTALEIRAFKTVQADESLIDSYRKTPVTLYFKNGAVKRGNLLQNTLESGDYILVEINGKYESIDFDELLKLSRDLFPFATFGNTNMNHAKGILDNFIIALRNDPTNTGYIIYYDGRDTATTRFQNQLNEHFNTRGFNMNRITSLTPGCLQRMLIELYVVPIGSPETPRIKQTIPCSARNVTPPRQRGRRRR